MPGESDQFDAIIWMAALVGVLLVGVLVVAAIRRRMGRSAPARGSSFSLQSIRELRDGGKISQAEFENLRREIVDGMGATDDDD